MSNYRLCGIFGENPDELEFGYDEEYFTCAEMKYRLVMAMQSAIEAGFSGFASTLDQGASMWGAEACAAIKQLGGRISLEAAPESEEQAKKWHPERRDRYFSLLEAADVMIDPSEELFGEEYILSAAERVIILGKTELPRLERIHRRAKELGKEVVLA